MRVTMIRPCDACPARVDIPGYLRPGRAAGIIAGLLADDWAVFPCHKTTVTREDPETFLSIREMVANSQMCAGFMIMLLKLGRPPVRVRLALISGELRYEDIDMAAPVAETPEQLEEHHASSWRTHMSYRNDPAILSYRELDDGRLLALVPLLFNRLSITLGPGGADYDGTFNQSWDYENIAEAVKQFYCWNPATSDEPEGWIRHTPDIRRRGEVIAEAEAEP